MRILIISKFFPPENSIASLRPYSWARYWAEAGHEVKVLTTIKDRSRPEATEMLFTGFSVHEVDFPSAYHRLKHLYKTFVKPDPKIIPGIKPDLRPQKQNSSHPAAKPGFLRKISGLANDFRISRGLMLSIRMPDNLDFWIGQAVRWSRDNGPWDLVVSTHGPYAPHLIAEKLKQEKLAKLWVADFRDLWTDNHIYKGMFPFTLAEQYLERKTMRYADRITTVSEPLARTLARKYGPDKVFVIENGFDIETLQEMPAEPIFPPDGKKRIIHAGTIYKGRRDPTPFFKAIAALAKEPEGEKLLNRLEVIFLGSNPEILQEGVIKYDLGRWVKIGTFLPRTEVLRMQRDADVLLFLESDGGKMEGILTGKLFEYLSSGTQIWGVGVGEQSSPGELIKQTRGGILFGEDVDYLRRELSLLLKEKDKRTVDIDKGVMSRYDRKSLAFKMINILQSI